MDQNKQQQSGELRQKKGFQKELFSEAVYLILMSRLPHRVKALAGRFGISGGEMRTVIIRYVHRLIDGDSPAGLLGLPRWPRGRSRVESMQEISLMLISADMRQPLKKLAERFGMPDIQTLARTMMYVGRFESRDLLWK